MSVLVIAEHTGDELKEATLHAVTAARELDADVHLLVAGKDCGAAAEAGSRIQGVSKVLVADDAAQAIVYSIQQVAQAAPGTDISKVLSTDLKEQVHKAAADVVMARTSGDPGDGMGITAFMVPMDTPGVKVEEYLWTFNMPTDHGTVSLKDVRIPGTEIFGGEGKGLRRLTREHCDVLARLPMKGSVESLNVSVAAGVCLYECVRQRG